MFGKGGQLWAALESHWRATADAFLAGKRLMDIRGMGAGPEAAGYRQDLPVESLSTSTRLAQEICANAPTFRISRRRKKEHGVGCFFLHFPSSTLSLLDVVGLKFFSRPPPSPVSTIEESRIVGAVHTTTQSGITWEGSKGGLEVKEHRRRAGVNASSLWWRC